MADSYKAKQLKSIFGNDLSAWIGGAGRPYSIDADKLYDALLSGKQKNIDPLYSGTGAGNLGAVVKEEFDTKLASKTQGIDLSRINDAFTVIGGTPAQAQLAASTEIVPAINDEFNRVLGRDATQAETAAIANSMDFKGFIGGNLGSNANIADVANQIITKPGFLHEQLKSQGGIEGFIKQRKPMFDQITLAQSNLKNIGKTLGADEITNILNSTPEQAKELSASYVKSYREGATNTALEGLPAKQKAVFDELDQALRGSQESFFTKDLQPSIERALSASGKGLRSGSLAEALASQAGKLNTAREGILSPLRSQTALGTQQLSFENTLRGALESGKTLTEATGFINDIFKQDKQNQFASSEAELNRIFQGEQNAQNQALMLALQSGQSDGLSSLDMFYKYGLPVLGGVLGGPLGGALASGVSSYANSGYNGSRLSDQKATVSGDN